MELEGEALQNENKIVLACEVPESATPGSSFHVQLGDRYFEVVTPEGAVPGQTINIIVPNQPQQPEQEIIVITDPSSEETVFGSVLSLTGRAIAHAKNLDEQYKITEKLGEIAAPAMEKVRVVDEKYQISQKATAAGTAAQAKIVEINDKYEISTRTNALVTAGAQKLRAIDEAHRISERAKSTGGTLVAYAREIDARYAVSATAARIVDLGRSAVVAGFNKAVEIDQTHHISERAAALIASGATVVANQVTRLTATPPTATMVEGTVVGHEEVATVTPITATAEKAL